MPRNLHPRRLQAGVDGSEAGGPSINQQHTITSTPVHIFGERTWGDVRIAVLQRLRRRFPSVSKYDLEDAAGYALVDLLDYWIHLPNSIHPDNPGKTFWFAVRRGVWRAGEHLADGIHAASKVEHLEDIPGLEAPDEEVLALLVEENFERDEALRLVQELDDTRAGWLKGHLQGMTERAEAAVSGVSAKTIHSRRRSAITSLRVLATNSGLLG